MNDTCRAEVLYSTPLCCFTASVVLLFVLYSTIDQVLVLVSPRELHSSTAVRCNGTEYSTKRIRVVYEVRELLSVATDRVATVSRLYIVPPSSYTIQCMTYMDK